MKSNLRLLCCLLSIIGMSGCKTFYMTDQSILGNQQPESAYNYANEVNTLSFLYPELNIEEIQLV